MNGQDAAFLKRYRSDSDIYGTYGSSIYGSYDNGGGYGSESLRDGMGHEGGDRQKAFLVFANTIDLLIARLKMLDELKATLEIVHVCILCLTVLLYGLAVVALVLLLLHCCGCFGKKKSSTASSVSGFVKGHGRYVVSKDDNQYATEQREDPEPLDKPDPRVAYTYGFNDGIDNNNKGQLDMATTISKQPIPEEDDDFRATPSPNSDPDVPGIDRASPASLPEKFAPPPLQSEPDSPPYKPANHVGPPGYSSYPRKESSPRESHGQANGRNLTATIEEDDPDDMEEYYRESAKIFSDLKPLTMSRERLEEDEGQSPPSGGVPISTGGPPPPFDARCTMDSPMNQIGDQQFQSYGIVHRMPGVRQEISMGRGRANSVDISPPYSNNGAGEGVKKGATGLPSFGSTPGSDTFNSPRNSAGDTSVVGVRRPLLGNITSAAGYWGPSHYESNKFYGTTHQSRPGMDMSTETGVRYPTKNHVTANHTATAVRATTTTTPGGTTYIRYDKADRVTTTLVDNDDYALPPPPLQEPPDIPQTTFIRSGSTGPLSTVVGGKV